MIYLNAEIESSAGQRSIVFQNQNNLYVLANKLNLKIS